jgi:hypothetical protein
LRAGIAQGRSCTFILVIPQRKTALVRALHGWRPWPDFEEGQGVWLWGGGREGGAPWGGCRRGISPLLLLVLCLHEEEGKKREKKKREKRRK